MIMKVSVFVYVLNMYLAMVSGYHEGVCMCVYVEDVSSYDIW